MKFFLDIRILYLFCKINMKRIERYDVINTLIKRYKYKKYLEIGVHNNECFDKINIEFKKGIDPKPLKSFECVSIMTSDDFFKKSNHKWDIIFIDGLHIEEQVDRDISNSLACLNLGGIIALHDCRPKKIEETTTKRLYFDMSWHGTVWKSFVKLRMTRNDLVLYTIDEAPMGIIHRGRQNIIPYEELTFEQFISNEKYYLNLITADEFLKNKLNKWPERISLL